jgi:hypothetical protein
MPVTFGALADPATTMFAECLLGRHLPRGGSAARSRHGASAFFDTRFWEDTAAIFTTSRILTVAGSTIECRTL